MDIFPWNNDFNTGIDEIDEQHKVLVSLLNRLASHLGKDTDTQVLDRTFKELASYAVFHFRSEELLWEKYFPTDSCLKGHKETHESFLSTVLELKAKEATQPIEDVIEDVLAFLTHWLAFHILDSDIRMSKTVLGMKSGLSLQSAQMQADKEMGGVMAVMLDTSLSMYDHLCSRTLDLKREINSRKKIEAKLRLAYCVFDNTLDAICITDRNSSVIEANPAFYQSTGYEQQEVIGQHIAQIKSDLHDEDLITSIWQRLEESDHWSGEIKSRNKNGELQAEWLTLSTVKDEQGIIISYIGIFSNISRLIKNQLKLEHIAHHDVLTNLPNRLLLADRLEQSIVNAIRNNEQFAVCYIDLDAFKPINDQYSHAAGDQVLIEIAQRLKQIVRGNDTVARIGGDEFVILLNELKSLDKCKLLLNRLLAEIDQPITVQENRHHVTASIGVAIFPDNGNNAESLLQLADEAMYEAKRLGKSRYCLCEMD